MNTNVIFRVVGILGTLGMLFAYHHLLALIAALAFVGAFVTHYTADVLGDKFFTDEPVYVQVLRHFGFASGISVAILGLVVTVPHIVLWLTLSVLIHLTGDAISVKEDLKQVNFLQNVVLYPFIGHVGLWMAILAVALSSQIGTTPKVFALVGLALAQTGFIAAHIIYPDGADPASYAPPQTPAAGK